ncbi:MAG: GRAM domain-containing protein [Planctomycetota bacterium]|nr:GRAM domain-containing protein [Planctomycetota bacterium]
MKTPKLPGERWLRQARVNKWRGIESVGGRLHLTSMRLIFEAHPFNFQRGTTCIALDQIVQVQPCRTLGLLPNGLLVRCHDGRTHRFIVWARMAWIEAIQKACASLGSGEKAHP